ncbi:EamA family transporter [Streptomyces sp. SID8375]|uniref:DMT family transporter n=1 Tax=unclassified Streptomyces TaxID=2593676 RepID=UPI00037B0E91|nr:MULTISPECIES: DMT family transporter [unclassified Streptomyces]MCW7989411.1 membrane protein [Streptomyces platensis subsp. clarensis]MYX10111.1 EamA family transporter [Streptomyces sp. SID8375]
MRSNDSATATVTIAVSTPDAAGQDTPTAAAAPARGTLVSRGALLAALGVAAFSLTFPATAWALEGMGPWTVVMLRSVLAAVLAGGALTVFRVRLPERRHWTGIAVVAGGVVLGFPLLTTLALQTSTTSHAAVVIGLLPLTTAAFSAVRTGARPSRTFWIASLVGAVVVIGFAVQQSGGAPGRSDLLLFAALLVCAAGYTEGGRLARHMPGWQVIGWALVLALPVTVAGAAVALSTEPLRLTAHAIGGLLWLATGSQFLGMVAWYRGMAAIGIHKASQLQLAQPLLTLVWSVLLLGEQLPPAAPAASLAVLACIAVTQRSRG